MPYNLVIWEGERKRTNRERLKGSTLPDQRGHASDLGRGKGVREGPVTSRTAERRIPVLIKDREGELFQKTCYTGKEGRNSERKPRGS